MFGGSSHQSWFTGPRRERRKKLLKRKKQNLEKCLESQIQNRNQRAKEEDSGVPQERLMRDRKVREGREEKKKRAVKNWFCERKKKQEDGGEMTPDVHWMWRRRVYVAVQTWQRGFQKQSIINRNISFTG